MHAVLLAAGSARRMGGRDKLTERIDAQPLLRVLALRLLDAGMEAVAATLRDPDPQRLAAISGLPVTPLPVPDAHRGMSASLRAAALWARGHDLLVLPGDMPDISAEDLRECRVAFDGKVPLRATAEDGTPGHPVIFPAHLLPLFETLEGDSGARPILRTHPPSLLALPGRHAVTDLDTPEAWATWHAARQRREDGR